MSSPTKSTPTSNDNNAERRRSSNSGLFGNLLAQKRSPENAAYSQRRQSLEEQGSKQGVFGQMWNTVIKGAGPNPESK